MRVLVSSISRDFGGVESLFLGLLRDTRGTDLTFDFVCADSSAAREEDFISCDAEVYHMPRPSKHLIRYIRDFMSLFKRGNYDIYHVNLTRYRFPLDILIARFCGLKIVLHCHATQIYNTGSKKTKYIRKIEQLLFRPISLCCSNLNIACSENAAEYLFHNKENVVVHNGIAIENFIFNKEDRERLRADLGLQGTKVIGHIGRFSYEKNHIYMLKILEQLLSIDQDYRLLLVGSGDLFDSIKEEVVNRRLEKYVIFVGQRTDIPALLSAMDVFLFPSIHEALPMTLIEAQANGLPCVISDYITKEIDVLDSIVRISVDADSTEWIRPVMQALAMGRSEVTAEEFNEFDINTMSEKLYSQYKKLAKI